MDGTRPWIARALIGVLALAIAAGLFATASFMVSAVMPLMARLHLHGPREGVVISVMSSMTSMAVVMWLVLARRRKTRAEPDVVSLPRPGLPKAG
jgi:predicted MFS family arabinose efflux permease